MVRLVLVHIKAVNSDQTISCNKNKTRNTMPRNPKKAPVSYITRLEVSDECLMKVRMTVDRYERDDFLLRQTQRIYSPQRMSLFVHIDFSKFFLGETEWTAVLIESHECARCVAVQRRPMAKVKNFFK